MRNPVTNMKINSESLEMYAEITKVIGVSADFFDIKNQVHHWTLTDGIYVKLQMVEGEDFPVVIIEDCFDYIDKIYQIIGYAHYRDYKVICNF